MVKSKGRRLALYLLIASQILTLLRNILVARIIGPEEFGIASVIILTIVFLGSLSNAGPQNLLVQAKDEDPRPLLAAAHSVTVSRGLGLALLILLAAAPLSQLFGLRIGWPAIIGLSVSSMVGGFVHHGVRMAQRDGDFRLEGITQTISDLAAGIAAVAVALVTHSHISIVAGMVARSLILATSTRYLARQPYELNWERAYLRRFWSFGWPLLINGPLMFLSAQADRLFISRELGATALGVYAAVLVLIASPTVAVLKWLQTIYIPPMARQYHEQGDIRLCGVIFDYTALVLVSGFLMFAGFATLGVFFLHPLYGAKYTVPALTVALIGCLQVLRYVRGWPSGLSLALAASGGILASTTVRLIALPIGFAGLAWLGGLQGLLVGFIVGEFIALVISLLIVNRNGSREFTSGLTAAAVFAGLTAAVGFGVRAAGPSPLLELGLLLLATVAGTSLLLYSLSWPQAVTQARRLRDHVLSRLRAVAR